VRCRPSEEKKVSRRELTEGQELDGGGDTKCGEGGWLSHRRG
jgi:hypothetical protein